MRMPSNVMVLLLDTVACSYNMNEATCKIKGGKSSYFLAEHSCEEIWGGSSWSVWKCHERSSRGQQQTSFL